MMENNLIKRMGKSILRNRKQSFMDRNIMHPERDWFVGIFAGLAVLIVGVVWSTSIFSQFSDTEVSEEQSTEEGTVYKAALVESALMDLNDRTATYDSIKRDLLSGVPEAEVEEVSEEVAASSTAPVPVQEVVPAVEEVSEEVGPVTFE